MFWAILAAVNFGMAASTGNNIVSFMGVFCGVLSSYWAISGLFPRASKGP